MANFFYYLSVIFLASTAASLRLPQNHTAFDSTSNGRFVSPPASSGGKSMNVVADALPSTTRTFPVTASSQRSHSGAVSTAIADAKEQSDNDLDVTKMRCQIYWHADGTLHTHRCCCRTVKGDYACRHSWPVAQATCTDGAETDALVTTWMRQTRWDRVKLDPEGIARVVARDVYPDVPPEEAEVSQAATATATATATISKALGRADVERILKKTTVDEVVLIDADADTTQIRRGNSPLASHSSTPLLFTCHVHTSSRTPTKRCCCRSPWGDHCYSKAEKARVACRNLEKSKLRTNTEIAPLASRTHTVSSHHQTPNVPRRFALTLPFSCKMDSVRQKLNCCCNAPFDSECFKLPRMALQWCGKQDWPTSAEPSLPSPTQVPTTHSGVAATLTAMTKDFVTSSAMAASSTSAESYRCTPTLLPPSPTGPAVEWKCCCAAGAVEDWCFKEESMAQLTCPAVNPPEHGGTPIRLHHNVDNHAGHRTDHLLVPIEPTSTSALDKQSANLNTAAAALVPASASIGSRELEPSDESTHEDSLILLPGDDGRVGPLLIISCVQLHIEGDHLQPQCCCRDWAGESICQTDAESARAACIAGMRKHITPEQRAIRDAWKRAALTSAVAVTTVRLTPTLTLTTTTPASTSSATTASRHRIIYLHPNRPMSAPVNPGQESSDSAPSAVPAMENLNELLHSHQSEPSPTVPAQIDSDASLPSVSHGSTSNGHHPIRPTPMPLANRRGDAGIDSSIPLPAHMASASAPAPANATGVAAAGAMASDSSYTYLYNPTTGDTLHPGHPDYEQHALRARAAAAWYANASAVAEAANTSLATRDQNPDPHVAADAYPHSLIAYWEVHCDGSGYSELSDAYDHLGCFYARTNRDEKGTWDCGAFTYYMGTSLWPNKDKCTHGCQECIVKYSTEKRSRMWCLYAFNAARCNTQYWRKDGNGT